jgi:hypothetical protein
MAPKSAVHSEQKADSCPNEHHPACPNGELRMREVPEKFGAGEGNRTLVFSLEGCCSTIELHPRATDQLSCHRGGLNRHAPDP